MRSETVRKSHHRLGDEESFREWSALKTWEWQCLKGIMEGPVKNSETLLDYLCFRVGLIEILVLVDRRRC